MWMEGFTHFVLTLSQMVHESGAPLRVFFTVETVQFRRDGIQFVVGVKKLRQQRTVSLLKSKCKIKYYIKQISFVYTIKIVRDFNIFIDSKIK